MNATQHAKRLIPAAQALTLVTTAACSADPMVGDWIGTNYTYEGYSIALPYTYVYEYGAQTYTYTASLLMRVTKEFTGSFELSQEYAVNGTVDPDESYTDTYSLTGIKIAKGQWDLTIPDFYTLELTCTADKDLMNCVGVDEDDASYDIDFERSL